LIVLIYVILALLALFFVGAIWGVLRLRQGYRVADAMARKVTPAQIDALREECERVFLSAFSETLSLSTLEKSAKILSDRLDKVETLKTAFGKPDFYWYFVLPVGAYIGELIRIHAAGEWLESKDGGLEMRIPVGGDFATTYPLDKVLKQITSGSRGDLYAYLMTATRIEVAIADIAKAEV
jgi:hypothetical protein